MTARADAAPRRKVVRALAAFAFIFGLAVASTAQESSCPPGTVEKSREVISGPDGDTVRVHCKRLEAPPSPPAPAAPPAAKKAAPGPLDAVLPVIDQSPTLKRIYADLVKKRYKIVFGTAGRGTYVDRRSGTIVIDPDNAGDPVVLAGLLSHEFGHTRYKSAVGPQSAYKRKDDYVAARVKDSLADEGEATLVSVQAEHELKAKKVDIAVPGMKKDDYEAIYKKYPKATDRAKARDEIGSVFGSFEHPSTSTTTTYSEYYSIGAAQDWDAAHPSKSPAPAGDQP